MMTTDTVPKTASASVGEATIVGVAKGVGMIEPDMATLLTYVVTDAAVAVDDLRRHLRPGGGVDLQLPEHRHRHVDERHRPGAGERAGRPGRPRRARGRAPRRRASTWCSRSPVTAKGRRSCSRSPSTAAPTPSRPSGWPSSIVNSPLVKTAVHGCDPNWGRVAMAIGKAWEYPDIDPERTTIRFGAVEVFPRPLDDADLAGARSRDGAPTTSRST